MILKNLMESINVIGSNIDNSVEIVNITNNSKKVKSGWMFVCLVGKKQDGHDYMSEAVKRGAAVILTQKIPDDLAIPYIQTYDTRRAEALIWMNWYGNPSDNMRIIGITGTNGKTSISYMLRRILKDTGIKTALLGTIKNIIGDEEREASLTTPDSEEMAKLFYDIREKGIYYVIMEVSSHALELEKVAGLRFKYGIFTNLTQDHLDFHGTMENYLKAKSKLFKLCDIGMLNMDDPASEYIAENSTSENYFYSAKNETADFYAKNIKFNGVSGIEYDFFGLDTNFKISSPVSGMPYVYNSLAAAAVAKLIKAPNDIISTALAETKITGRIEKLDIEAPFSVFIDYAHTPDALLNLLNSVKEFVSGRIITLFGCGGERDREKRFQMGRIASDNSDFTIITSDNPRGENPLEIIEDIVKGINKEKEYKIIPDRTEAIKFAVNSARENDIILLAGKGHEEYVKDKNGTHYYSEREVVFAAVKSRYPESGQGNAN